MRILKEIVNNINSFIDKTIDTIKWLIYKNDLKKELSVSTRTIDLQKIEISKLKSRIKELEVIENKNNEKLKKLRKQIRNLKGGKYVKKT